MAKPCRFQLPGEDVWMSENEFKQKLNDGLLDKFLIDNKVSIPSLTRNKFIPNADIASKFASPVTEAASKLEGERIGNEKEKVKKTRTSRIHVDKEAAGEKRESNLRGVKYSDIVIGGKFLDEVLDENNLSEEDKKIIREQLFDRNIEYFDFDKDSEAKWQLSAANPEDINDISDALTGLSAAEFNAFDAYSQGNYENIKPGLEYIIKFSEKGEYSDSVINTAKEI